MVEQRLAQQANADSVEELKMSRCCFVSVCFTFRFIVLVSLCFRKKAQEQRDVLLEECTQLKRKCMAHEEEVRAMGEQVSCSSSNR